MSENLLSRLEQSLRQSRAARMHLAARLRELEAEADSVRAELAEMDTLASQTEAAIYRLFSSVWRQETYRWVCRPMLSWRRPCGSRSRTLRAQCR